jgi:hypothetical protein
VDDDTPILRADALDDCLDIQDEPEEENTDLCPFCGEEWMSCGHPTGVPPLRGKRKK